MAGGQAARDRARGRERRRGRRPALDRRHGAVSPSAGAVGDLPGGVGGAATRGPTARWPTPPIRRSIPIAAPGTERGLRPAPTRTSPPSSNARPAERSAAGVAAAAAFLERATELTADPARRARRALAAAQAKHEAGALDAALSLLPSRRRGHWSSSSAPASTRCAHRSRSLPGAAATPRRCSSRRPSGLNRWMSGSRAIPIWMRSRPESSAARWSSGGGVREVAKAVLAAPPAPPPPRAFDLLLDGLAQMICEGHGRGAPRLKQALRLLRDDEASAEEGVRWLWLAGRAGGWTWDYESWDVLSARQISLARASGALIILPIALSIRAGARLLAGDLVAAASLVQEVVMFTEATGSRIVPYAALVLAAFRGRESEASRADRGWHRRVPCRRRGPWAEGCAVGCGPSLQRSRSLRAGAGRGAAGRRRSARAVVRRLGMGRADRGGLPDGCARAGGAFPGAAFGDDPRERK